MTTIRTAFYARVSSEQQAAAHTIESQTAVLSERAQSDGTPVPPERQFVDDGCSGATLIRPALDRLRDLATVGAIDRIYVHSPDRLARNYAYQVLLLDEWRRCGVELVFLNRPDRKSTRLNSSHSQISYAVFCLKKKKKKNNPTNIEQKKSNHTVKTLQ